MTYTQVWNVLCSYVCQLFPEFQIRKQYAPIEDFEELANTDRPICWIGLSSTNISSVNTNADLVEDAYTFRFILAWKLRNNQDQTEFDSKLNAVQRFLTVFRHKGVDVDGSRLYFGLPNCDSPFDEDFITSPGLFVSTCSVPVSVYRNLRDDPPAQPEQNASDSNETSDTEAETVNQEN